MNSIVQLGHNYEMENNGPRTSQVWVTVIIVLPFLVVFVIGGVSYLSKHFREREDIFGDAVSKSRRLGVSIGKSFHAKR